MTSASLEPGTQTAPAGGIPALTGIRAIAAFSIAAGHLAPQRASDLAIVGMPLFFTLSGFIIHYVYAGSFAAGWPSAACKFAAARFSRIFPLYLGLLVLIGITTPMMHILHHTASATTILAYGFAFWTWFPIAIDGVAAPEWYYGVAWSVPTEIFFYGAYALVLYRLAGIRRAKTCLLALIALCLAAYAWFYFLFLTRDAWEAFALSHVSGFATRGDNFANSLYRWFLYISPYSRIFEFIGGCLTCQLFLLRRRDASGREQDLGWLSWLAAGLIGALLILYHYAAYHHPWLSPDDSGLLSFFINLHMNFLFAPLFYALFLSLALGRSVLSRVLSSGLLVLLGEISYATYLGHGTAAGFIAGSMLGNLGPRTTALEFVAVYAFSWILYSSVEMPAKATLRRLFATRFLRFPGVGPDVGRRDR